MKTFLLVIAFLMISSSFSHAQPQWIDLSKSLNELDVRSLAVDARDSRVIFAGSERRVYKTADGGVTWKQVLGVRGGDNHVRFIHIDSAGSKTVYVGTDKGVLKSEEAGKHWKPYSIGLGAQANSVLCMASSLRDSGVLWIGTRQGLIRMDKVRGECVKVSGLPAAPVYSILPDESFAEKIWITTEKGIYRSVDTAVHWERVFAIEATGETPENTTASALEQFRIEEFRTVPTFSNLVFLPSQNKFYAATAEGVLQGNDGGAAWKALPGQTFNSRRINFLARSAHTFYVATDLGVYQWEPMDGIFHEIYEGLASKEIHALAYNPAGDYLLAATSRGVFKLLRPEWNLFLEVSATGTPATPADILRRFEQEPAIQEIQKAAIEYAEVHPRKIQEWRNAAARKALFPTVSLNKSVSEDENIDLDRGGTADPDRFIRGPEEKSDDWSVGASWNLGNLIWNDDQTSIDTRSRLMVELRDDVLTQVTHLYYERRRLQVERAMSPNRDLSVEIEKEIRLQELTASIDALTGGYLSRHLKQREEK